MEDVLQVVSFNALLRVEQFKELLNELRSDEDLKLTDLNGLVDNKLEEELVDTLEVWPGGIHFFVLIDARLRKTKVGLLDVGQWSEDVLLDHRHHLLNVWNDQLGHVLLVGEHLLELLHGV